VTPLNCSRRMLSTLMRIIEVDGDNSTKGAENTAS